MEDNYKKYTKNILHNCKKKRFFNYIWTLRLITKSKNYKIYLSYILKLRKRAYTVHQMVSAYRRRAVYELLLHRHLESLPEC